MRQTGCTNTQLVVTLLAVFKPSAVHKAICRQHIKANIAWKIGRYLQTQKQKRKKNPMIFENLMICHAPSEFELRPVTSLP